MSIRADVISITVNPRLPAKAVTDDSPPAASALISVPGPSGRRAFKIRTGMFRATAG